MPPKFVAPVLFLSAFTCPHCSTLTTHAWDHMTVENVYVSGYASRCSNCREFTVWYGNEERNRMVFPNVTATPEPNSDLPPEVLADYKEAASIVGLSPRGAAALLRLAVQKLCIHLGQPGKNINDDIAALVREERIRPMIARAMDTVRIAGNEAVHPGELNLDDDVELVEALFRFVNVIAEEAITGPATVEAMFGRMPESKRAAVQRRDGVSESSP